MKNTLKKNLPAKFCIVCQRPFYLAKKMGKKLGQCKILQ